MKIMLGICLCLFVWCTAASAQSGYSLVFPQFADGRLSDGTSYRSTIVAQSYDSVSAQSCSFWIYAPAGQRFTNSTGQVLVPDTTNRVSFNLGPLRSQTFRSSGTNAFSGGFVGIGCIGAQWNAYLLYSFYSSTGVKLAEATVFPSAINSDAPAAQLVVDQREGAHLGIALANADSRVGEFNLTIRDSRGTFVDAAFISLPAFGQTAKFLDELVSLPANFVGTVAILPKRQFAGPTPYTIGLRFTGQAFTTVPVTLCYSGDFCSQ